MSFNLDRKVLTAGVVGAAGCVGLYMYLKSRRHTREYHRAATVSQLFLHPVKSLAGIEVEEGHITDRGFMSNGVYDRSFMMVGEKDNFITARIVPKMILIRPSFSKDGKHLVLSAEGQPDINVPLDLEEGEIIHSLVYGMKVSGIHCGDEVAKWLSDYLEGSYRLIYYSRKLPSKMLQDHKRFGHLMNSEEAALFQNFSHFTLLSEASVDDLNTRLEEPVTGVNFRPNIYVKNCPPYAEDFWKYVKIGGDAEFRFTHYCGRCNLVTLNLETGKYTSQEPLKTLKEYRQCYDFVKEKKVYANRAILAVCLNTEALGTIRVGDPVYATLQFLEHQEHVGKESK